MKKKFLIIATVTVFALSAAACSAKGDSSKINQTAAAQTAASSTAGAKDAAAAPESGGAEASKGNDGSKDSAEGSITGSVDENKGFMITVISDEDSEAYIFNLDDSQSEKYKDLKAGEKVTVSYKNGLPTPDNLDTVVTDIQAVK